MLAFGNVQIGTEASQVVLLRNADNTTEREVQFTPVSPPRARQLHDPRL